MELVKGLERFRMHFEEYTDRYVLIGGVASLLVSEEQGLDFRATRDLDIVLCVEALDDSFMQGRKQLNGITLVGAEHLVPLKANAFLNLSRSKAAGTRVDSRDIRKHVRDVVRLARLLTGQAAAGVPDVVRDDVQAFMDQFPAAFDFTEFRASGMNQQVLSGMLRSTYLS